MKKFMFSAVALVAFSFAGMANNSVEKEVKDLTKEEKKEVVEVEVVEEAATTTSDCSSLFNEVFAMWYDGNNFGKALSRASAVRSACEALQAE